MAANDRPSSHTSRVNYLRRRPRPGALVRQPDLPLPHELDQTEEGMTDGQVPAEGRQAHDDLERGLQDTSKPVDMDKTYRRQKR